MPTKAPIENVNSNGFTPASGIDGAPAEQVGIHNMSWWDMFMNADIVVQLVIITLIVSSIICWAIIFEKWSRFKLLRFQARKFERVFWSGESLERLHKQIRDRAHHPMSQVFVAAMDELNKSNLKKAGDAQLRVGIKERVAKAMHITKNRCIESLENRLGFLATIGSTAPFIGLFGTVWGIMHSFTAIAASKNTSLVAVAPGIAEALFATAIGLIAAIPAVIAYNKFSSELNKYVVKLEDFADEFETLISRQMDEGKV